jgi:thioredoxin 2
MSDNPVLLRCGSCNQLNRVPSAKIGSRPLCGSCKTVIEIPREPVWVKNENFDRMVAQWPETLLAVFTAPMCVYCKIFEPVLNTLAKERAGRLKVLKIDTETDNNLAQLHKIKKTPTFIVYKNAVELIRVDGPPKDKADLVTWIDNLIGFTSY